MLLEAHGGFRAVGESADGRDAVRQVRELRPDVVIMDIAMPELNGIEAARMIREACPRTEVVVLSMHGTREHVFRSLKAGAHGYLLKRSAGPELIDAVEAVCRGERYLSKHITDVVVEDYVTVAGSVPEVDPLDSLSVREREVLQLVAEGNDNDTTASKLNLSPKTVHTYRGRMMRKLGLHDSAALVRFAVQHALTPEE